MGRVITVKQDGQGDFTTIQEAVDGILPGDTVLVYDGIYREEIMIPRGGTAKERVTVKAAEGHHPQIIGSEKTDASCWTQDETSGLYICELERDYFGKNVHGEYFNPFAEQWMSKGLDKPYFFTCGCVYLDEVALEQTWSVKETAEKAGAWYAEVDTNTKKTIIYANFGNKEITNCTIEINKRMQCITAAWNQGYITIDGFKISRACGPKTIDFWMKEAKPMYGAIATNGGYCWIIENCVIEQCRGVGIDFGNGSHWLERVNGGEPECYGHHIIRNNRVANNATNGMMAYRGAYTEICGNVLANNNALNTGLMSEAYIKDVSGGFGLNIHDNYLYSDQDWVTNPIWLDSECDFCRVSGNLFYCKGSGKGFDMLNYECNNGWNLIDNNIFVGVGWWLNASSSTYLLHNLWLDIPEAYRTWPSRNNTRNVGTEGFDGYTRCMRIVEPGTLKVIGKDTTSRWQTFNNNYKFMGNMMFDRGMTNAPGGEGFLTRIPGGKAGIEAEKPVNGIHGEMVLNVEKDENGQPIANADYSGGTWKHRLPSATEEEKEAARRYQGVMAWIPADEDTAELLKKQLDSLDAGTPSGCECDYNFYGGKARCLDNREYAIARGYLAEEHSVEDAACSYTINADENHCSLILNLTESAAGNSIPMFTGEMLGASPCYQQAAEKYGLTDQAARLTPDDVDRDYFSKKRLQTTVAGPFAKVEPGTQIIQCWPKA